MNNEKKRKIYRHGDVLLYEIFENEFSNDKLERFNEERFIIKKMVNKINEFVIKEGAGGHKHILVSDKNFYVFEGSDLKLNENIIFIKLENCRGILKHEEHKDIQVEEGLYAVLCERNFNYLTDDWENIND